MDQDISNFIKQKSSEMNNAQNQNNVPSENSSDDDSKKNKIKIIIIVVAVAVVIIIFALIMLFRGGSSSKNGGHTVNYGKTLEINEMNNYYDFDVNVLSIEKNYHIDSWFYSGDCYALKVSIKNNSKSNLSLLSLINFTLMDSSNNKVTSLNTVLDSMIEDSIKQEIPSGETASGYLYFYNVDTNGDISNIDASDITKLKISVPKELNNSGSNVTGEYSDYYINLK